MQDVKTIKNVKPVTKGTGKSNIFSIFLQAKQKMKEKFETKYGEERIKNLGKSKRCDCGKIYGVEVQMRMKKDMHGIKRHMCIDCFNKQKENK